MSTISDLLAAFGTQLTGERAAYGIAHDLGHALPSLEDAALRELRDQLVQTEPEDPQVSAVVATLVEVVDGYRLGRRQTITLSLRDGVNRAVLCALERRAATTSELAEMLSRDESQISRAIARLRELDLVDPPQRDAADRRRIEHRLSLAAKQALGRLDQRARRAPVWQLSAFGSLEERTVPVDDQPEANLPDPIATVLPSGNYREAGRVRARFAAAERRAVAEQRSASPPRDAPATRPLERTRPSAAPLLVALNSVSKKKDDD